MKYEWNAPFLLQPAFQDYLWGGCRLKEEYHKETALSTLAESWECSVHPDGLSLVATGVFQGRSLKEVLEEYPEFLGSHPRKDMGLPILVKLIDAKEKLSIQVHPSDEYAAEYEKGSQGKTEMWYVLEADEEAYLTLGFARDMDQDTLTHALETGTLEKYLQKIPVKKNDVFYVEAGTVHGIGAGTLIAEIQENSNLTYRLYDYERLDKDGNKRPLHIKKAMEVVDYQGGRSPRQPLRVLKYKRGCATEFLCRCQYFQVERMLLSAQKEDLKVAYQTDDTSFEVLLCVEGSGELSQLPFKKGDCIFVPANSKELHLRGKAQLLKIHC